MNPTWLPDLEAIGNKILTEHFYPLLIDIDQRISFIVMREAGVQGLLAQKLYFNLGQKIYYFEVEKGQFAAIKKGTVAEIQIPQEQEASLINFYKEKSIFEDYISKVRWYFAHLNNKAVVIGDIFYALPEAFHKYIQGVYTPCQPNKRMRELRNEEVYSIMQEVRFYKLIL